MTAPEAVRLLAAARSLAATRAASRPTSPAALAARLIPGYNVTPAISLISDALRRAITQPGQRIIISTPPRTGKSALTSQVGPVAALAENPDTKVILASYGDELAREHSHAARAFITEHADLLGYGLRGDKTAVGRWRVDAYEGGLLASGILSSVTGFGADLLILDDVVKNAQEADSPTYRRRVIHEFRASLMTRLHPGGSVVIVGTRWHPEDLIGTLLAEESDVWDHINIPAVAEAGIPDALDRRPGAAMISALGRTPDVFASLRRTVGERTWYALFQGVPSPPEGGLVQRAWLDAWRLSSAPLDPLMTVVGVDPSDSGRGDSCGLVAVTKGRDGVAAIIADRSRPMTSDEWARAAVELAYEVGASEIAIEGFAARETYVRVANEALDRHRRANATDYPVRITSWPPAGTGRGRGDSVARSAGLLQALETGRCRIVGHLAEFEERAVTWQSGQHQPDSLAAALVAFDVLDHAGVRVELPSAEIFARRVTGTGRTSASGAPVTAMSEYLRRRMNGRVG